MRRAFVGIVLSLALSSMGTPSLRPGPVLAQSDEELAGLRRQIEHRRQTGNYADALSLAQRLVAAAERRFGPNHVTVAASLNSLAIAYEELGLLPDAERTYRRTLAIIEKSLGAEHQNVGVTLGNLAIVHQRQGRYAEALPLATRSLAIAQKAHGPDHPSVAVGRCNQLCHTDFARAGLPIALRSGMPNLDRRGRPGTQRDHAGRGPICSGVELALGKH